MAAAEPVKTVTIAGIKISQLSLVVLITALILAFALLFVHPIGFLGSLTVLLGGVLAAYNVNCVQVGSCTLWAWILTAFYVINAVIFLVAGTGYMTKMGAKSLTKARK